jgi:hypothetical protein
LWPALRRTFHETSRDDNCHSSDRMPIFAATILF